MNKINPDIKREYSFCEYDKNWPHKFSQIKTFLAGVFGDKAISINHIGSTSIPGMKAKPVIDVLVIVHKIQRLEEEIKVMSKAGYTWGENYIEPNSLIFFKTVSGEKKIENIHVCEKGSPKTKQFIVMRDYLRSHPEKVKEYSDLKEKNANLFPTDYPTYRAAKAPYLEQLEIEAYEWKKLTEK